MSRVIITICIAITGCLHTPQSNTRSDDITPHDDTTSGVQSKTDADAGTDTPTDTKSRLPFINDDEPPIQTDYILECTVDNDSYDLDTDTDSETSTVPHYEDPLWPCNLWTYTVRPIQPHIMILMDASSSMAQGGDKSKWNGVKQAITDLMNTWGCSNRISFGLDFYPKGDHCDTSNPVVLDTIPYAGETIHTLLDSAAPHVGSPLNAALKNYLDPTYAPLLTNSIDPAYLIVFSDGPDTCDELEEQDNGETVTRQSPLGKLANQIFRERGIEVITIGIGDDADVTALDTIAANGISTIESFVPPRHHSARSRGELSSLLHDLVESTLSCDFLLMVPEVEIPESLALRSEGAGWEETGFILDGESIPHDPNCEQGDGWSFVDYKDGLHRYKQYTWCPNICEPQISPDEIDISLIYECYITTF